MGSKWFKYGIFHIHQSLHVQRNNYTAIIWRKIFVLYAKNKVVDHPARLSSLISSIAICYLNIRIALQAATAYPKLWQISVNETSEHLVSAVLFCCLNIMIAIHASSFCSIFLHVLTHLCSSLISAVLFCCLSIIIAIHAASN